MFFRSVNSSVILTCLARIRRRGFERQDGQRCPLSGKMWSTLLAFALAAPHLAHGLLRFPCAQLTVMRADPCV
jgi:hypothetical protein